MEGIDVRVLQQFSEQYPEIYTYELQPLIQEITSSTQTSYCKYLLSQEGEERHFVGPHLYFISHCWAFRFRDVAEAIIDYDFIKTKLSQDKPVFVWFDMFSFTQHRYPHSESFLELVKRRIRASDRVLSVWAPYKVRNNRTMSLPPNERIVIQSPLSIKRIWCLFELFYGYKKKEIGVSFIVSNEIRQIYRKQLRKEIKSEKLKDFDDLDIIDQIDDIDIKDSIASVESDKILILNYIKDEFSRNKTSKFLQDQVKAFIFSDLADLEFESLCGSNKYIKRTAKSFEDEFEEIEDAYIDTKRGKIRRY